jgi:hypothetical protein
MKTIVYDAKYSEEFFRDARKPWSTNMILLCVSLLFSAFLLVDWDPSLGMDLIVSLMLSYYILEISKQERLANCKALLAGTLKVSLDEKKILFFRENRATLLCPWTAIERVELSYGHAWLYSATHGLLILKLASIGLESQITLRLLLTQKRLGMPLSTKTLWRRHLV